MVLPLVAKEEPEQNSSLFTNSMLSTDFQLNNRILVFSKGANVTQSPKTFLIHIQEIFTALFDDRRLIQL